MPFVPREGSPDAQGAITLGNRDACPPRLVWFRFLHPELDTAEHWWFGIGPKGIGSVGMLLNFVVSVAVGACFPAPSASTQDMVRAIRVPKGAGAAAPH